MRKFVVSFALMISFLAVSVPSVSAIDAGVENIDGGTFHWVGLGNLQCLSEYYHRGRTHWAKAIGHNTAYSKKPAMYMASARAKPWAGHNQAYFGF